MVEQAHRLCAGLFKQDTTGSVYSTLKDRSYSGLKWNNTSIIPSSYNFTNINRAGTTVETTENAFITDLSKVTKYASGKVTPGAITLASILPADAESIHSTLRNLTGVDDPYLCLFLVGAYKSGIDTTSIVYDVYWASAVILTEDGSAQAEANQKFTGNLALQASGIPTETIATNAHTLTWNTSTGAVTFAPPAPGTNPS
ncbi:MAG: hypothetical protein IJL92_08790 [Thermoguttaceae bacterium]|nr:hypothetical protein [Thermoguttaceae bacterium]